MFKKKPTQPEPSRTRITRPQESSKVFSYYGNRSNDLSGRSRIRHEEAAVDMKRSLPKVQLSYVPMFLATVAIVICIGYNFLLSSNPRVIVQGTAEQKTLLKETNAYEKEIHEELRSSFLNRSKLTFQPAKTTEALSKRFPELSSVKVALPLMGIKPVVYLEPATPALVLISESGSSYVVDDDGRVISADVARVPSIVPVVNDRSGIEAKLGGHVLASTNVEYIQRFMYQMNAKNIAVESLLLPGGSHELQVRLKDAPYIVRTSLREDPMQQAGTLISTRNYMAREGVKPAKYVDIRVGERVFYR